MSSCSPTRFEIRAGDLLPVFVAKATAIDAATGRAIPIDFTGWTALTFKMTGPRTVTGDATGDASGVLSYAWGNGDTNAPGLYRAWFSGVSPTGKLQTFPTKGYAEISIERL